MRANQKLCPIKINQRLLPDYQPDTQRSKIKDQFAVFGNVYRCESYTHKRGTSFFLFLTLEQNDFSKPEIPHFRKHLTKDQRSMTNLNFILRRLRLLGLRGFGGFLKFFFRSKIKDHRPTSGCCCCCCAAASWTTCCTCCTCWDCSCCCSACGCCCCSAFLAARKLCCKLATIYLRRNYTLVPIFSFLVHSIAFRWQHVPTRLWAPVMDAF